MNCRPGDLAIRVGQYFSGTIPVGSIVRVLKILPGETMVWPPNGAGVLARDVWLVEWSGEIHDGNQRRLGIPDSQLVPIREPGDDATDETLQWLPVPSKEVAHG